jgi:hypothetical protein
MYVCALKGKDLFVAALLYLKIKSEQRRENEFFIITFKMKKFHSTHLIYYYYRLSRAHTSSRA